MSPWHDKKCLAGVNLDAFFSFSKKYQTFDEFNSQICRFSLHFVSKLKRVPALVVGQNKALDGIASPINLNLLLT